MRRSVIYAKNLALAADTDLTLLDPIELGPTGYVGFGVVIDNGAGSAPSDSPVGTFELHVSADGGKTFAQLSGTSIAAQLLGVAPGGNAIVRGFAAFRGVPGTHAKLKYKATSGGASTARATITAITEP